MTQSEQDMERIKKAAVDLAEFFETVQIVCTRHGTDESESDTTIATYGKGNWFARLGSVREWLLKQDERTKCEVWKEQEDE